MRDADLWLGVLAVLGIAMAAAAIAIGYMTAAWAIDHHLVARSIVIFHKMERWAAKP